MKVIITKDCKDGKVNDVIEVSNGYASNFLIKKGFAIPYNAKTNHALSNKLKEINENKQARKENSLKAKKVIESTVVSFKLKTTNNVVHGSITRKQIHKELMNKGIKVDSHWIDNVKISSIGITKVNIKLQEGVTAELKVEVKDE